MPPIAVKALTDADRARWDAFVTATPDATFCHRSGWRNVIERAFGHRTHYVYAERDGAITGVLPLTEIRSRLFGHSLVSNAFGVYGGPVAVDGESLAALTGYAAGLLERTRASHIEFRSIAPTSPGWLVKDGLYVTFRQWPRSRKKSGGDPPQAARGRPQGHRQCARHPHRP
jgi:hypothetical protein